jgi:hypothetical protein
MAMGSPTLNRKVQYTFEMVDNIVPKAKEASKALKDEDKEAKVVTESIDSQNLSYIKCVASMGAFRHGIHSIAMGMETLGIINKETNKTFYQGIAVIDLFVGAAMAIKGIIGIMQMLKVTEVGVAQVETYRKVLNNPANAALVGLGIGAAVGIAGAFMALNQQNKNASASAAGTVVNQNISFSAAQPNYNARYTARASIEGLG